MHIKIQRPLLICTRYVHSSCYLLKWNPVLVGSFFQNRFVCTYVLTSSTRRQSCYEELYHGAKSLWRYASGPRCGGVATWPSISFSCSIWDTFCPQKSFPEKIVKPLNSYILVGNSKIQPAVIFSQKRRPSYFYIPELWHVLISPSNDLQTACFLVVAAIF